MTLQKRASTLYEAEEKRWEEAWDAFYEQVWQPITDEELELYVHAESPTEEEMQALQDRYPSLMGIEPETASAWSAWQITVNERTTGGDEPADLSLWPHALPLPPDEPPGLWERARGIFNETASDPGRRLKQMAAVWTLIMLSIARTVRYVRQERVLEASSC